ncbi:hypothetical protein MLD38_015831 [Melastoma candidum]|uniref:Uncharacterized protein n=1 Tax=Melastoma candidum TaxID=119954 RepID=A0ACB9RHH7_9MYRT|nr:hypothetical protein MLD38_015831 [Melastoma candidum]
MWRCWRIFLVLLHKEQKVRKRSTEAQWVGKEVNSVFLSSLTSHLSVLFITFTFCSSPRFHNSIMSSGDGQDDVPPWLTSTGYSSRDDLNSKIMLASIVSLSVVVLLVAHLHIYARHVRRSQAQRRPALRRLGLADALQFWVSGQPPKTGLDPSVLSALPMFAFKFDGPDEPASTKECTVCLSVLEEGEMTRCLPNCKHVFHAECIDRWFGSHTTCPVCRTEAEPWVQPASGEPPTNAAPMVPPLEADTSENSQHPSAKVDGSSIRLSSFTRMLGRERSPRRTPSRNRAEDTAEDLERQ